MIVDLFAGPGGWSEGLRLIGLDDIGIEWDAAASATRAAAGHRTVRADVAGYPRDRFVGRVDGLIASPPCQDFSRAGKGAGRTGKSGELIDTVPDWVADLRPQWVACEQVPPALPVWEEHALFYRTLGYKTWVGVLNAADYGVPQTRRRAILIATRDRPALPPDVTHSSNPEPSLFETLAPWVTMAEALGWSDQVVGFPRRADGGEAIGDYRARDLTDTDEPAQTVTEKARSWKRYELNPGKSPSQPNRRTYTLDEPAPTIAFGKDSSGWRWQVNTGRDWKPGGTRDDAQTFDPAEQPAPTVDTRGRWHAWQERRNDQSGPPADPGWPLDRPATTLAGRDLVTDPGANANRFNGATKSRNDGIRVTIDEALVLQSFRHDYPVQGNKTKRFEQVGNAVPPLLAAHIVGAITGRKVPA